LSFEIKWETETGGYNLGKSFFFNGGIPHPKAMMTQNGIALVVNMLVVSMLVYYNSNSV
jgi:hypothetical protein